MTSRAGDSAPANADRRAAVAAILASAIAAFAAGRAGDARAQSGTPAGAPRRSNLRPRSHALPEAVDLARDATIARNTRRPILLFFDRDDCPYCERALREHLVPMSRESPWREDVLFRQVEVDRARLIIDFDGGSNTHVGLARRYKASLTPTIVVVDANGQPIGDPIVGLLTADFYGAYIEDALRAAVKRLRE
ncbi:MAG: thioredoxin fold domain-containing protein [Burkholderiales bacterium]|nr:thioredoxin fold domain-containing protein [Burkholderiales bacterium]